MADPDDHDSAEMDFGGVSTRFVDQCLRSDGSLFTPGQPVWTQAHVDDLYSRFVEHPDETPNANFPDKLQAQTADADPLVVQLAAELLYVLLLPQATGGGTKRAHVGAVLAGSGSLDPLPADLAMALDSGIASYGAALAHRFPQYSFLLEFARSWKRLDSGDRETLLADPWRFRDHLFALPRKGASSQVEALLHMAFPETFEPIVSVDVKQKLVAAFREYVVDTDAPIDRQILEIREALTPLYGERFSFYDTDVRAQWAAGPNPGGAHAWFLRGANDLGVNRIPSWLAEGYASVGRYDSSMVDPGMSVDQLVSAVAAGSPDRAPEWVRMVAGNLDRFFRRMAPGDLVVTVDDQRVYVGEVHGETAQGHDEQGTMLWTRGVEWLNASKPASRAELPAALQSALKTQVTLTDLSPHLDAVRMLIRVRGGGGKTPENDDTDVAISPISDDLAARAHLTAGWLQQAIDLLNEKKQLIFYGPPGTGKTFVAQLIADHVRSSSGRADLVQFHPAYSYEDFFEGYRPVRGEGGGLEFALHRGPLRRLVDRALDDPTVPHLLVIDEINRGNIAKIFGELYFLLEYRNRPIHLQYSAEEFKLPENLFLIGTMNTADRSIALIDSALRRRFYFFPFLPHEPPIEGVLGAWLARKGFDPEPAELLKALNAALQETLPSEEFAIGPSYLMPKKGPPNIERVWRYAIMPLLEERFFGVRSPAELAQAYGYDALRDRIAGDVETPAGAESDPGE
jgi:5-methylcytosine-specific restriction protein B